MPATIRASRLPLMLILATMACSSTLGPGDMLTGHWHGDQVRFDATLAGLTLREPCLSAAFDPVVVDAMDAFHIRSRQLTITGNILVSPNDTLVIDGKLIGSGLQLQSYLVGPGIGGSDPVITDLDAGSGGVVPVCTA